jgi:hypothetical protein
MFRHLVLAAALLAPVAAAADDFRAVSGLKVAPEGNDIYRVYGVPTWGQGDYWCAIGDYALRVLRLDYNDRLYVVGDYQRGQRDYRFSTSPVGTASEVTRVRSSSYNVDGANKRVNAAYADCDARRGGRP